MEVNNKKIVKLEELLPFTDDQHFQYSNQDFDELVERIRVNNHEYGYWIYVRPDTNDSMSGKYEVDFGHEIVRAAEQAGLDSVTAIIMPTQEEIDSDMLEYSDDDEVSFSAFKNLRRIKQADVTVMV